MIDPINHAITIDLAKTNSIIPFYQLGQNDTASHKFVFSIFNNSLAYDLTSLTAKVYFTKEDTNGCFLICTIDDAVNGKMSCLLTTQCLTCPGIVQGEITIYGTAGEILTSITFKFLVKKIVRNDSAIESTSEFTALTTALAQVTDFANVKNELIAAREGEVDLPTKMSKLDSALANITTQLKDNITRDTALTQGNDTIVQGNTEAGLCGFVPASDFITGDQLALDLGIAAGISQNSDCPWIKYMFDGKVCFTPLKTHRHSITWDEIYNAGCVYGTDDEGTLPRTGRMGETLSIAGTDNSVNITTHFLGDLTSATDYADITAQVGDTVVLKGWSNSANNGSFTVASISDTKMILNEGTLVTESGNRLSKIYESSKAVTQNATTIVGGLTFRARLMRGTSNNPMDSSNDADRDGIGVENEWNAIMCALHERAKLQNFNYPAYVGTTEDFKTYLTDKDMNTHYTLGNGSYSWCQDIRDITSWRRVIRGSNGVSSLYWIHSWYRHSHHGLRLVLEFVS